jgi:hypothetical protein
MLYQNFGISVSFRRKRVCVDMGSLLELNGSDSYGMYDAGNDISASNGKWLNTSSADVEIS